MAIGAEESDAIAGLRASLTQGSREAPDSVSELSVGEAGLVADYRGSAGILLFRVAKKPKGCEWDVHSMPRLDQADWPPSTTRMFPVTKSDASEARKIAAPFKSCGPPKRPKGTSARSASLFRSMSFPDISVGNQPGAIALT